MSAILDVSKALKYPGQVYTFEVRPEIEAMEVLGDPIAFRDVVATGEFFGTDAHVSIRGRVTAQADSQCCRGLEPVSETISAEIDALLSRQADPDDPDLYLFEGSKADLTDAVRDALLLELPYRFLCSDDCKGL